MKRFRMRLRLDYMDGLLMCFFLGILCGSIAVNLSAGLSEGNGGWFDHIFSDGITISGGERRELLLSVLKQRFAEAGVGWLVGLTVFSIPCFMGLAGYAGISAGVIAAVFTRQAGILGLPCYVLSLFPHILFYIPVWYVLAKWAGENHRKHHLLSIAGLSLLILTGSYAEAYINPLILTKLFHIIS